MIKKYRILIVCVIVSYFVGYYASPAKVETKIKTEVKTVVDEKIKTVTVIKELPSGEKITTISFQNEKLTTLNKKTQEVKISKRDNSAWGVSVAKGISDTQISLDRRVMLNVFVGASVVLSSSFRPENPRVYLRFEF